MPVKPRCQLPDWCAVQDEVARKLDQLRELELRVHGNAVQSVWRMCKAQRSYAKVRGVLTVGVGVGVLFVFDFAVAVAVLSASVDSVRCELDVVLCELGVALKIIPHAIRVVSEDKSRRAMQLATAADETKNMNAYLEKVCALPHLHCQSLAHLHCQSLAHLFTCLIVVLDRLTVLLSLADWFTPYVCSPLAWLLILHLATSAMTFMRAT